MIRDRQGGALPQRLLWHTGGRALTADGRHLHVRGHARDSLLVTFADVAYRVTADARTWGACADLPQSRETITAIVTGPAGVALPEPTLVGDHVTAGGMLIALPHFDSTRQ